MAWLADGLEATAVCTGAAPSIANVKEQLRPLSADEASIESIEYDGESPGDRTLRISFSEKTRFDVRPGSDNNSLRVRVFLEPAADNSDRADATASTRLQRRPAVPGPDYVINLESWQRPPVTADMPKIALPKDKRVDDAAAFGARGKEFVDVVVLDRDPRAYEVAVDAMTLVKNAR